MHRALGKSGGGAGGRPLSLPCIRSGGIEPDAERRQVLETFNATAQAYPQEALIHQLFEAQVAQAGRRHGIGI